MVSRTGKYFISRFVMAGRLCIVAAAAGLVAANTGLAPWYEAVRGAAVHVGTGDFGLVRPAAAWLSQLALALLVFVAGLECKRQVMDGELRGADGLRLPLLGALGGLLVPAAALLVVPGPGAGWCLLAMGMDMAIGLAVLGWLGERVPDALKSLFVAIGLFSCLGTVLAGAAMPLAGAGWGLAVMLGTGALLLLALNLMRVVSVSLYLLPVSMLWVALARSPLHAAAVTLLAAVFIPLYDEEQTRSPLVELEQDLLSLLCFVLLPLSVLANVGLPLQGGTWTALAEPRQLGVLLGLFPGKALGVFGLAWLGARLGLGALPPGVNWTEAAGACVLSGTGLAAGCCLAAGIMDVTGGQDGLRLALLAGATLSLTVGAVLLRLAVSRRRNKVVPRT